MPIEATSGEKGNKGYSLVEAIVIMGIMTILAGIMSIGISLMFSRDAQSVAVSIDDQLTETRMLSMTKEGRFVMTVHMDSDSRSSYVTISCNGDVQKKIDFNKRDVDINFSEGSSDVDIEFNKTNGSVKEINKTSPAENIYTFTVKGLRGSQKEATVTLISTTGRHYTDK